MPKIVRRIINHKYFAIKSDMLKEGTEISFDCYIKRFDDFVIIIEAGTLLTSELLAKVQQNDILYAFKPEQHKVREYYYTYVVNAQDSSGVSQSLAISKAMGLEKSMEEFSSPHDRLKLLYETTAELMQSIFEPPSQKLPIEALRSCTQSFFKCIGEHESIMSVILTMLPDVYSVHHHSTNVAFYAAVLAHAIGMSPEDVGDVAFAALLHDIGKIRIDENILSKPGVLEEDEYEKIKRHSEEGIAILEENGVTDAKILDGVRYHHEKLDGSGYPKRLKGKMIPKFGRIIGMCDAFDAMTTKRTFRCAYSSFEALKIMKSEMKAQFDENFIDTFIRLLRY